ncbi:MAG TPA: sigma-54 dependent transcriptional regulator [Candidatus Brocadiia bacterium]|nr:sigma-54 dependent transcriptional regulator [Candidatus Brocadiia bacterium]
MQNQRVLIVEDEPEACELLKRQIEAVGAEAIATTSGPEAIELINSSYFDLVITDLWMPGADGFQIIQAAHKHDPDLAVMVISGDGSITSAVQAMRAGAMDYVEKPVTRERLEMALSKAMMVRGLVRENKLLREHIEQHFDFRNIVGSAPSFLEAIRMAGEVAATDATVLLMGESGTGKELVARAIHFNSKRASKPFVPINCAALPESLMESELFGHEKGSFTGADRMQIGRLEAARGGTVFLDEIGEMSQTLQAKLLRFLQDMTFTRVGGSKRLTIDVRLISATNRNIEEMVAKGEFREDLYYRINVFPIRLPPLRERPDDILPLARHFVGVFSTKMGRHLTGISQEAERQLTGHKWPGNARELQNVIERAVILCDGDTITSAQLPWPHGAMPSSLPPSIVVQDIAIPPQGIKLDEIEYSLLKQAMATTKGNKSRAAKLLGLSRAKLRYRLKKHHLDAV